MAAAPMPGSVTNREVVTRIIEVRFLAPSVRQVHSITSSITIFWQWLLSLHQSLITYQVCCWQWNKYPETRYLPLGFSFRAAAWGFGLQICRIRLSRRFISASLFLRHVNALLLWLSSFFSEIYRAFADSSRSWHLYLNFGLCWICESPQSSF